MRVSTKFNVVLISVFLFGLVTIALVSYAVLHNNAREEVQTHAKMMMEAALAVRTYTIEEIKPLLSEQLKAVFLPQSVPSYAATQNFQALQRNNPRYSYKEATLNPTNPRDRATDWEADIIRRFSNDSSLDFVTGELQTVNGPSLYYARPIRIQNEGCLSCHSTASRAPETMKLLYGTVNGFGWKYDEVVGTQIVSVPLTVPIEKANEAFGTFILSLVSLFVGLFILINVMLRRIIISPIRKMSEIASQVSQGDMHAPAFNEGGKDEIAELAKSFNRMRVSLIKAMKMLNTVN